MCRIPTHFGRNISLENQKRRSIIFSFARDKIKRFAFCWRHNIKYAFDVKTCTAHTTQQQKKKRNDEREWEGRAMATAPEILDFEQDIYTQWMWMIELPLGYNKFDFPRFVPELLNSIELNPNAEWNWKCVNIILFQRITCAWNSPYQLLTSFEFNTSKHLRLLCFYTHYTPNLI